MSVLEAIDKLFAEKKLPLKKQEIPNNQYVYQGTFNIRPDKQIPFGVVIVDGEGLVDYQISFKRLAYLTNYNDKAKVLELINELNQTIAFYFTVFLAGDGEIIMKMMAKTSEDVRPVYDTLIVGSNVAKHVMAELEKIIPPIEAE